MAAYLTAHHGKNAMSIRPNHGLSSPVLVPAQPNWTWDYTGITTDQLVGMTDEQLVDLDPLAVNLIVAKGTERLADLDIRPYQQQVNEWAWDFANRYLPFWLTVFQDHREFYKCDERIFRVGMIQQFFMHEIGVSYHEEGLDGIRIRVLNPSDMFVNGLLDTLQGTCASMPVLFLAIAWRMSWPVSLACNRGHYLTRYDDGEQAFNVEAALSRPADDGGFCWTDDELEIKLHNIRGKALRSGSDLKALTPRERLGAFFMMRARHFRNLTDQCGDRRWLHVAERDLLLACYLFPAYREANKNLTFIRALLAGERFDPGESGHPTTYAQLLWEVQEYEKGTHLVQEPMPPPRWPGDSVCIRRSLSDTALELIASM